MDNKFCSWSTVMLLLGSDSRSIKLADSEAADWANIFTEKAAGALTAFSASSANTLTFNARTREGVESMADAEEISDLPRRVK